MEERRKSRLKTQAEKAEADSGLDCASLTARLPVLWVPASSCSLR
jgi:hypothetical protein